MQHTQTSTTDATCENLDNLRCLKKICYFFDTKTLKTKIFEFLRFATAKVSCMNLFISMLYSQIIFSFSHVHRGQFEALKGFEWNPAHELATFLSYDISSCSQRHRPPVYLLPTCMNRNDSYICRFEILQSLLDITLKRWNIQFEELVSFNIIQLNILSISFSGC